MINFDSILDAEEFLHPAIVQELQRQDAETIRNAAEVLESMGWVRGHLSDGGKMCTIGAVNMFAGGDPWADTQIGIRAIVRLGSWLKANGMVSEEMLADLDSHNLSMYSVVHRWNDAAFDVLEVTATLRKFADEMDPQRD